MAVAVTIDIPGGNEQFYEQMVAKLFPDDELPEGWLVHLAARPRAAGGWSTSYHHGSSSRYSPVSSSSPRSSKPRT